MATVDDKAHSSFNYGKSEDDKEKYILIVDDLVKYFPVTGGVFNRVLGYVRAVDHVSFNIGRGRTIGVVGESGCGKTTLGRTLHRLLEPTSGKMI